MIFVINKILHNSFGLKSKKYTVESSNIGDNRKNLSIKDTFEDPKCSLSHTTNTFSIPKERTTPYKGCTKWLVPNVHALYSEVPLCKHVTKAIILLFNVFMIVIFHSIQGRVPGAPVIIVGTHIDSIPLQKRPEILKHFTSIFQKMYLDKDINKRAYPNIHKKCFFVSSNDGTNISNLRDGLYEYALSIKPPGMSLL